MGTKGVKPKNFAEMQKKAWEKNKGNNHRLGFHFTEEQKKRMSDKQKGRHYSPLTEFKKGRKESQESIQKRVNKVRGRKRPPFSEEWKNNISRSKIGKKTPIHVRKKMSLAHLARREQNHLWRGGINPIHKAIRKSLEYKLWREAVFERDDYTCVWCGARSGVGAKVYLEADHIQAFSLYPELRFAIDNGRTLCTSCHRKTNSFGRRTIL